jgi:GNAT superfamily N-acetyltransferase
VVADRARGRRLSESRRSWPLVVRRARAEDGPAVLSFASRTWDGWDYVPHAWPVWLAADDGVLLVGCAGQPADGSAPVDRDGQPLIIGRPLAVARVALTAPTEAWLEGIRVDPSVRGLDVATDMQVAELHRAQALGASTVRYATGEHNEASHRLGARHGFELLTTFRTYWWSESEADDDDDDEDESGFGEEARAAAAALRDRTLARLASDGLVAAVDDEAWWARLADDATFVAGARLYEHRPWALQELTPDRFEQHRAAGEVLATEDGEGRWALAVLERGALPSEDVSLHLGLLVGDGSLCLRLASAVRAAAATSVRFRLPTDDPPLLRGYEQAFGAAGFRAREWTLHILARALDADHPPPARHAGLVVERSAGDGEADPVAPPPTIG